MLSHQVLSRTHGCFLHILKRTVKFAMNIKTCTPEEARKHFASGNSFKESTNGLCKDFVQANIAILPQEYASSFFEFCQLNQSCCPLLFQSKPGQTDAPSLAKSSDVRSDVSAYRIIKDGVITDVVENLRNYDFDQFVTFYIGCSFSFNASLEAAGIKLFSAEQLKACSMYDTTIRCHTVKPFDCNMVCSMRGVPKHQLTTIVDASKDFSSCHGAPIHIGWPEKIGINNLSLPENGQATELQDGEIPVFHACGVSSVLALKAAAIPLSFTHFPASMFVTDIRSNGVIPSCVPSKPLPPADVVCLNEKKDYYSVISKPAVKFISEIEDICICDLGNRGLAPLLIKGDLLKSALSLSQDAQAVAITTGFPCFMGSDIPEENDGIAGALCIAKAIQALGKSVTFVVDDHFVELMHKITHWCHNNGYLTHEASVVSYGKEAGCKDGVDGFLYDSITGTCRFSHIIAIERSGRNANGKNCTMSGKDISSCCDAIDKLFTHAENRDDIVTIGIGDGGNELGMGKVKDRVIKHIALGNDIACEAAADHLIVAGVSNWGGYGLAAAIYSSLSCPLHERYRRKGVGLVFEKTLDDFLPTVEKEYELHEYLASVGLRDGITGKLNMTVDSLPFYPTHADILKKIRNTAT